MAVHPLLSSRTCYHRFEIEPGLHTPGTFLDVKPAACLDELGIPRQLSGLRVLDVGAWDGAFTFELARRGADVTALDIQDPDVTVFNAIRAILKAPVSYVRDSVYDLRRETHGAFHAVLFAGVYYHLKNPALALQRIREVLVDDGLLYVEGASCSSHLAEELGRLLPGVSAEHLRGAIDRLPISFFDVEQKIYSHWSNWWFPTTTCLADMLRECGFRDVQLRLAPNAFTSHTNLRISGQARADAARPRPADQRHEHKVYERDFLAPGFLGRGEPRD
jgi:SAM-dependent methyltransferase